MALDDGSSDEKRFYVYAYLDPRKPGSYEYGDHRFDMEPFYIGKGHGDRYKRVRNHNAIVNRKTIKILKDHEQIATCLLADHITEEDAFRIESEAIGLIGRIDIKTGPLANFTDGGEGLSGHIQSEETKRKRAEKSKKWHQRMRGTQSYRDRLKNQGAKVKELHADQDSVYHSEEYKRKHSEGGKLGWAKNRDMEQFKEKSSVSHKRNWATPGHPIASKEAQLKRTEKIKLAWANPDSGYFEQGYKDKKNAKIKAAWATPDMRSKRCKHWVVIDPAGQEFQVDDLETFCKKHNLYANALRKVAYGRLSYYRHWTCRRDECQI